MERTALLAALLSFGAPSAFAGIALNGLPTNGLQLNGIDLSKAAGADDATALAVQTVALADGTLLTVAGTN